MSPRNYEEPWEDGMEDGDGHGKKKKYIKNKKLSFDKYEGLGEENKVEKEEVRKRTEEEILKAREAAAIGSVANLIDQDTPVADQKVEFIEKDLDFYNPIDDLKIAYSLEEDESGFIKLVTIGEDLSKREEAKKRLVENEYDLLVIGDGENENQRNVAKKLAESIKSLLSIYAESWIKSNKVLSQFMGINTERLKKEKVVEETKKVELGEPVFYDQIFEDLYLSVQGESDEKNVAIGRLGENGIKAKQYDRNSENQRLIYVEYLKNIHEDIVPNKRELEWVIIKKHKLDNNEELVEKYRDVVEKKNLKVDLAEPSIVNFVDLIKIKSDLADWLSDKIDIDRATIKVRLKEKGLLDENGVVPKEVREKIKSGKIDKYLVELLGVPQSVEKVDEVKEPEKKEKKVVLDNDLWKDFGLATKYAGGKVRVDAQQRIKNKGIDFDKAVKEIPEFQIELLDSINVVLANHPIDGLSVEVAKKKLMDYFGVVEGEEKKREKLEPEPKPAEKVEKKESRRMELGAMFAQYENVSENKVLWGKWKAKIEGMVEGSKEREYAIKQLQATMYLYNNPMERLKHADYWRVTGMAIMRDLRAKEV